MDGQGQDQAEAAVLARVGAELAATAAAVKALQGSLGPALEGAGALGAGILRDLQDLDRVEQVLASLAALMADLLPTGSRARAREPVAALLDRLPLSDLAARLRGADGRAAPAGPAGELDLF